MTESTERRQERRQHADSGGSISFGGGASLACHIIDLSTTGAQVRIDGRRASRNLVGKRTALALEAGNPQASKLVEGRVVWARPAVNGVYLGIALDAPVRKPIENVPTDPGT
ncbi:MAG: PilZ domain-containing protein [Candidatus Binatia bacterium]